MKWQPIETAPEGIQMLIWEPMYGWLLGVKEDGRFQIKSSGNFYHDLPESVSPTNWHPLPDRPVAKSKEGWSDGRPSQI